MAKLELPAQDWTKELISTSVEKASKAAGATAAKMLNVPVGSIRRIPGFNVRVKSADYLAHTDSIAQSIMANGFYANKPLGGYAGMEDGQPVIFLTDGYTRLDAVESAIAFGTEIATVPVVIKPQTENIEDLTVALVQDNEGRPLSFYEKAIVVKRLLSYNMEKSAVAKRISVTERAVDDFILVAGAPAKVRDLLIAGKVSGSLAVVQLRKNPEKAADVLKAAVSNAEAAGKTKASAKHVGEPSVKTTVGDKPKVNQRKSVYELHAEEIVPRESIAELLAIKSGDLKWWSYVDEKDKSKGIQIARDLKITLLVEDASIQAPAAAATEAPPEPVKPVAKPKKEKPQAPSKPGTKKPAPIAPPVVDDLDDIKVDEAAGDIKVDEAAATITTDAVFDEGEL